MPPARPGGCQPRCPRSTLPPTPPAFRRSWRYSRGTCARSTTRQPGAAPICPRSRARSRCESQAVWGGSGYVIASTRWWHVAAGRASEFAGISRCLRITSRSTNRQRDSAGLALTARRKLVASVTANHDSPPGTCTVSVLVGEPTAANGDNVQPSGATRAGFPTPRSWSRIQTPRRPAR